MSLTTTWDKLAIELERERQELQMPTDAPVVLDVQHQGTKKIYTITVSQDNTETVRVGADKEKLHKAITEVNHRYASVFNSLAK